jgi:hypothetical protein
MHEPDDHRDGTRGGVDEEGDEISATHSTKESIENSSRVVRKRAKSLPSLNIDRDPTISTLVTPRVRMSLDRFAVILKPAGKSECLPLLSNLFSVHSPPKMGEMRPFSFGRMFGIDRFVFYAGRRTINTIA